MLIDDLHASLTSGGSEAGMSYWAKAAACGKMALIGKRKGQEGERHKHYDVGSVYHKLHELWRLGNPIDVDLQTLPAELTSPEMVEGIRLFNGWRAFWDRDFWGRTVAVEKDVAVEIAGEKVTARPDLVVDINESDLERIRSRVEVPAPGRYIIDFKTAAGENDPLVYSESLQAVWYPNAWLEATGEQIEGIIFDIIYKHPRRKDRSVTTESFGAVFAGAYGRHVNDIQGLVEQGKANVLRAQAYNLGNRAECVRWSPYKAITCPYYGTVCDGA